MALGILLEKATPYRLRYQVNADTLAYGAGAAAAIQAVTLPNAAGTTPDLQTDAIASSPLLIELTQNLKTTDLDLNSYLANHPNIDVKLLTRKSYKAQVGTDSYMQWFVEMIPSNKGLAQFNIVGPSSGGTAALEISYIFSEID